MPNSDIDIQSNVPEQNQSLGSSFEGTSPQGEQEHAQALVAFGYSGPIPSPEALERYEEVLPGAADRILSMAERQASHRQSLETADELTVRTAIAGESRRSNLGLWLGASVSVFLTACGTFLVFEGHDWAGASIIISTIASVVGVFVYGTQSRRAERLESIQEFENESQDGGSHEGE
jgi:uncharacterized membrane protein